MTNGDTPLLHGFSLPRDVPVICVILKERNALPHVSFVLLCMDYQPVGSYSRRMAGKNSQDFIFVISV